MSQSPLRYWQPKHTITLLDSTGSDAIDLILHGLISLSEGIFPNRVRGYYLEGSYADGIAVPTSDIDLRIVFKGELEPEEKQSADYLIDCCRQICTRPLDIALDSEVILLRIGAVRFQYGSILLYGDDIRQDVPLKPRDSYIRDTVYTPFQVYSRLRGNPGHLSYPLTYPDPDGEFYGYDRRQMRMLDGTMVPCTKDLVLTTILSATARIALEAGQYVISKNHCLPHYRTFINDQWTDVVASVYETCRNQWFYLVPEEHAQRQILRTLCEHVLDFENDFLIRYRDYLLQEIDHPDDSIKRHAVIRLGRLHYPDDTILATLTSLAHSTNAELRDAAVLTLSTYR